jgi:membrane protease YdiL (CAAX protease family)
MTDFAGLVAPCASQRWRWHLSSQQKIALAFPPVLLAVMYPVFQWLSRALGKTLGWYFGLVVYWLVWGALLPWLLIGGESIRSLIRPLRPDVTAVLLVLLLLLLAGLYRRISGMEYQKTSLWAFVLLLSTTLGNGFFEELLWRGVYMELFPDSALLRIVWPSIWFGLWHLAPGSVSSTGSALGLVIGSTLMGFYLTYVAQRTGTIWWTIVAHTLGGLIMVA